MTLLDKPEMVGATAIKGTARYSGGLSEHDWPPCRVLCSSSLTASVTAISGTPVTDTHPAAAHPALMLARSMVEAWGHLSCHSCSLQPSFFLRSSCCWRAPSALLVSSSSC